ncbi:release factor glutamine methyltransferase [Buchnera aphidicola (Nipponaphis monzeni)]|uniref:Release factor glutamine methyltransferase n=1 Tax=Buchnera aphidicola (Nipponaphis monzeni) TaxID=2495405 RepID=A0A455TA09_9GAMM|nr:peptide chain release factor N(5)-glutamine methyltransferase [Buchnera aphidicola]BBI01153.1 release factor glutamine methyltransferase [Buchnera aphidicola (Nipponaphis monzeni)]
MIIKDCLNLSIKKLISSSTPQCDAEVLLSFVLKKNRSYLMCYYDKQITSKEQMLFEKLLLRRMQGEPVAYLIKRKDFWSLSLKVDKGVFIPRPETELLVELVLNWKRNKISKVLDLGTGCGAIALALAASKINWSILGIDRNKKAIKLSKYNLSRLKLYNVKFLYSNYWFSKVKYLQFDFIVSNPPYLSKSEFILFNKNIRYEPINSLVSNIEGLYDIMYIIHCSKQYLVNEGWLFLEHGWKQKDIVKKLFKKNGFKNILSFKDHAQKDRVVCGQKK